jgi:hypothetical protein
MKNKTSILVVTKHWFYTLLVAFIFCGCDGNVQQKSTPYRLSGGIGVEIVTIDSCEYIKVNNGNASWGSHKGNCKFCVERLNTKTK